MALLQESIKQIDDPTLRQRIMAEVGKLSKQKKFGLVFEEHLPECTPLYDVDIRKDSKVALKTGQVSDIYIVRSIDGDKAKCEHRTDHAEEEFALDDLVAVAEFGEPIYPYLKPINENYYCVAVYNKTHGFRTGDICTVGEIVAWRPLPELYRPERNDNV